MRRLLLVVLALLVACGALLAAPAGAADRRTLRVPSVGLTFSVPKSWKSVDARAVATEAGRQLRAENPELVALLDQVAAPNSPVKLLVFDPATLGGFVTNANVVVTDMGGSVPMTTLLAVTRRELSRLPGLVGKASVRLVTLPAGEAVRTHLRAAVIVKGRRLVADINQVAFLRDGKSIVVTITSGLSAARRTAPVVTRTTNSIRFA